MFIKKITQYEHLCTPYEVKRSTVYICGIPVYRGIYRPTESELSKLYKRCKDSISLPMPTFELLS